MTLRPEEVSSILKDSLVSSNGGSALKDTISYFGVAAQKIASTSETSHPTSKGKPSFNGSQFSPDNKTFSSPFSKTSTKKIKKIKDKKIKDKTINITLFFFMVSIIFTYFYSFFLPV